MTIGLADPAGASLYEYFRSGQLQASPGNSIIEGIGINHVTDNVAQARVDVAFSISDEEALPYIFALRNEGLCMEGLRRSISPAPCDWPSTWGPATIVTIPVRLRQSLPEQVVQPGLPGKQGTAGAGVAGYLAAPATRSFSIRKSATFNTSAWPPALRVLTWYLPSTMIAGVPVILAARARAPACVTWFFTPKDSNAFGKILRRHAVGYKQRPDLFLRGQFFTIDIHRLEKNRVHLIQHAEKYLGGVVGCMQFHGRIPDRRGATKYHVVSEGLFPRGNNWFEVVAVVAAIPENSTTSILSGLAVRRAG